MVHALVVLSAFASQYALPEHTGVEAGASTLILNEFMVLPVAASTQNAGQWVEIHNNSRNWVNLAGWSLVNHRGDIHLFGTFMLPPEGYFVLGGSSSYNDNGGYTPNAVWSGFSLAANGELTLYSPMQDYYEKVQWNSSWPVQYGASCERINPGWDSGLSSSWGLSQSTFGNGDFGTPGTLNSIYSNSFVQNSWAFIKAFMN
jgi:hypothetical protein